MAGFGERFVTASPALWDGMSGIAFFVFHCGCVAGHFAISIVVVRVHNVVENRCLYGLFFRLVRRCCIYWGFCRSTVKVDVEHSFKLALVDSTSTD